MTEGSDGADAPDGSGGDRGDGSETDGARGEGAGSERAEPADLADRVRERRAARDRAGDPFESFDDGIGAGADPADLDDIDDLDPDDLDPDGSELFEREDVQELDEAAVWASLDDSQEEVAAGPQVGTGEAEQVDRAARPDRGEHVVPKRSYCQRCPYFTEPPEVACGHETGEIVAVEDVDHFRVRGCPVVEEESSGTQ